MGRSLNNWRKIKFGDYFQILSGFGFQKSEYSEDGVRLLRIDNVGYGQIQWSSVAFLPTDYTSEYPNLVLEENDILLALNRPVTNNRLKIARLSAEDVPAILYQRVGKILSLTEKVFNGFLFYLLQYHLYFFVLRYAIGSDQPYISLRELYTYELPLLPLPEQRAIAAILGTWDRAIALTERRLAAAEQRKQALMQQLLTGRVRFAEFAGEAWREVHLSDVSKRVTDGTHKTPQYVSEGVPFISTNNLIPFTNRFDFSSYCKFITQEEHNELTKRCNPQKGDLLISKCGTIGRTQLIRTELDFSVFVGLALVKLKTRIIVPEFLEQLLNEESYQHRMEVAAPGGTRATLTIQGLKQLKIYLPTNLEEQRRIAAVLQACDREIDLLRRKRDALRAQKQGLMQRLLTGRVRVKV